MKEFIKPDFNNNVLNISATLAEFLGVSNSIPTLDILKKELNKNYKNIVYICFDGLGVNPLKKNLDEDNVLMNNIKQILTSTFPSTTTNATNSLMTNTYPLTHGWLGWSLYFSKLDRCIDIFLNRDSYSKEIVEINEEDSPIKVLDYYFYHTNSDYHVNSVFPIYVKVKDIITNYPYDNTLKSLEENILSICDKKDKQFVYAYCGEPDTTMHEYGVSSKEAKDKITQVLNCVENLVNKTQDTLFIISADHGQVDIEGYVEIYKDEEIMSMLKTPPYLDARAVSFMVKEDSKNEFEKMFNEKYSEDFTLYKTKDLVEQNYFGKGDKAYLLGDYIAIGTYTHKIMILSENSNYFKGHHTSLTEEMEVPLILISN